MTNTERLAAIEEKLRDIYKRVNGGPCPTCGQWKRQPVTLEDLEEVWQVTFFRNRRRSRKRSG